MAHAHRDDTTLRHFHNMGVFHTLSHLDREHDLKFGGALAEELRGLDATVREWLALGLLNTLVHVKEDDLDRCDALLDGLRALYPAHGGDAAVRERLAMGLFNTLVDAKDENDLARRDALLDELRALAQAHGEDAAVRWRLTMGLFNTIVDVKSEDDLRHRDTLMEELRALAARYPDDEWLQDAWRSAAHVTSRKD